MTTFDGPWTVQELTFGQGYEMLNRSAKRIATYVPEPAIAELMAKAPHTYDLLIDQVAASTSGG